MKTIDFEQAVDLQVFCKLMKIKLPNSDSHFYKDIDGVVFSTANPAFDDDKAIASAYTFDELIEILPKYSRYNAGEDLGELTLKKRKGYNNDKIWFCGYFIEESDSGAYWSYCTYDENMANAACKLLIEFIREGLV